MDGTTRQPGRRTLTPAVLAAALFTAACAAIAITFVTARGGLQMPVATVGSAVAGASGAPSPAPSIALVPTSAGPTPPLPTPVGPSIAPSLPPVSTAAPSTAPTPSADPDPLTALPGCPGIPGCYEYTIRRGDSLSAVASKYVIAFWVVLALNPEVTDPSTIVVGQTLYLGRDPFLRLPACPDATGCSLYTVRPGDRLSTIAGRFGISVQSILGANPEITDPNAIFSGQVIRLPHPTA